MSDAPLLFLDTGSTRMSIAARAGAAVTQRRAALPRSSEALIELLEEVLEAANLKASDLSGVVVLQGPGSFTGLRVGMAAGLALHQALGVRATAVPTLEALSYCSKIFPALCVADAQRRAWYGQLWSAPGESASQIVRYEEGEKLPRARCLVGFDASAFARASPFQGDVLDVENLAGLTARRLPESALHWELSRLTEPLYLSPAATTLPKSGPRVAP
ncbi:MAG: tRNA (adenosine(37)-N6)-threonylcarbamoyltransferase complex dimerization subunit type 1 TsaB [Acidobacteriota bacterium]